MNPNDGKNKKFEVKQNRTNLENEIRNPQLDATNIVNLGDKPLDLNMMSFIKNCIEEPEQIDTSKDLYILETVSSGHDKLKQLLSERFKKLTMAKSYWDTSISSTISGLTMYFL